MTKEEFENHEFWYLMSPLDNLDGIDETFLGCSKGEDLIESDAVFKFFNKEENIDKPCIIDGGMYFYFDFYSKEEAQRFLKKYMIDKL